MTCDGKNQISSPFSVSPYWLFLFLRRQETIAVPIEQVEVVVIQY